MTSPHSNFDAVIIGAGMAGASLGAQLAPHMSVLIAEMEDMPGYHATGRSVAFWTESYGGPDVRPLTSASRAFLERPDPEFSEQGFLHRRGAVHIGRQGDEAARDHLQKVFADDALFTPLTASDLQDRISGLHPDWVLGLEEPSTCDIDVAALHGAYLRAYARHGGTIAIGERLVGAERSGQGWHVRLSGREVGAGMIINAAGAWADQVAQASGVAPLGIQPMLRTVVQLRVDPAVPDDLPLVLDLSGRFYFKPAGGGRIWLTPHDETPVAAGDVAPDEMDVAIAIERLQQVVGWRVEAVERKWAGLRSFAPDRLPVYGFDSVVPGFFWFAGQGGFGIQTAPAAALLGAGLVRGTNIGPALAGIDPAKYAPARFR
ncbi:MAG: FAD-dependent oxidoreductase [Sphingobium sp.]|nr:FAD-binding oxidoreductase [Sphingobium sp.]MCP5399542.1 FAD-binding oxidoreductase [Sphingomonas sp.]